MRFPQENHFFVGVPCKGTDASLGSRGGLGGRQGGINSDSCKTRFVFRATPAKLATGAILHTTAAFWDLLWAL